MNLKKTAASIVTGLVVLLSPQKEADACTGARQIAMGGTGVTIADNSHASYWNNGLIPFLDNGEVSYTRKFGDMDTFRYDDVVSLAMPFNTDFAKMGVGAQYMNSSTEYANETWKGKEKFQWARLGLGIGRSRGDWDYSVGLAGSADMMDSQHDATDGRQVVTDEIDLGLDTSGLVRKHNTLRDGDVLRAGFLYRPLNSEGLRPEISYTFPNMVGDFTSALGYYGLVGSDSHNGVRFGVEQKMFGNKFAVRAGYTDYDSADSTTGSKDITVGAGYEGKKFGVDVNYSKEGYGLIGVSAKF